MPEDYETASPSGSDLAASESSTTLDTAKHEASGLKDTAVEQAKDVAGTVKSEASAVLGEAKSQARVLFAQTKSELKEQADIQQQRVAGGLKSVGAELDSMSANTPNPGLATDLVRQLSGRVTGAATWLGDRDPAALLAEVKGFARRKPGVFILGAAVAGIVVGRLTRALAANSADDSEAAKRIGGSELTGSTMPSALPPVDMSDQETPLYAQTAAARGDMFSSEGDRDVRSDTV